MKIGILTQPLHNNYGGLLQAYALQYYLKKQGHDVLTVDFSSNRKPRFWGIRSIATNIIKKYMLRRPIARILPPDDQRKKEVGQHTNRFRAEYIRTTQPIHSLAEFDYIKKYQFDAYIVGSDQVWRPAYSPGIAAFFLHFLGHNKTIKRIAYAASFGVDHCNEFEEEALQYYASLLKQFDAIGVREDSAVELCREHFGVTAQHAIDPTLLLDKSEYCALVERDKIPDSVGNMMVYVLDRTDEKQSMIDQIAKERGLTPYTVMQDENTGIYPPVTQWLRGFMDAEYVVTDSFHGVVFSIIFNKPFIAIGNKERGLARFESLLKIFNLQRRLITDLHNFDYNVFDEKINWERVNNIKSKLVNSSLKFLENSLSK